MNTQQNHKAGLSALKNFTPEELREHCLGLSRDEARKAGIQMANHLAMKLGAWSFDLNDSSLNDLANLLSRHRSISVFAAREDWFEGRNLEPYLRSVINNEILSNDKEAIQFSYPRCGKRTMAFFECGFENLEVHPELHVLEAPSHAIPAEPTLTFAPCTFADLCGNRMGKGRGYYDRFFAEHCAESDSQLFKVAVLHENFLFNNFPQEWIQSSDVSVDAILTNKRMIFSKINEPFTSSSKKSFENSSKDSNESLPTRRQQS